MILLEEEVVEEQVERRIIEAGGKHYQGGRPGLHCIHWNINGHDASTCKLS